MMERPTGSTGRSRGRGGDLSRSRLQALIREGGVTVGGVAVRDPGRSCGRAPLSRSTFRRRSPRRAAGGEHPARRRLRGRRPHRHRQAGRPRRPSGAGHDTGTLVNALIAHCGESLSGIGGVKRPGIVHRLDKDTSGLLVVAKNDLAHQGLAAQFADHGRTGPLERAYLALVWGVPDPPRGDVEAPLGRSSA